MPHPFAVCRKEVIPIAAVFSVQSKWQYIGPMKVSVLKTTEYRN